MGKKILTLLLFLASLSISAQIRVCAYYDGYWGEWEDGAVGGFLFGMPDTYGNLPYFKIYGNYSGFCIYYSDSHPSDYTFKFQANNYVTPDKKTKKAHLKNNIWYEYNGTVEYYVDDDRPTIRDILKNSGFVHFPALKPSIKNARKRSANATIKIAPYKDHPKIYNIWFEEVGVGIDLGTIYFRE
ncbi:hypothetical protein SAMN04487851_10484 [Prevotella sp. tc2-28]|uniref:DUF4230 domain-containing protein n=1 Tax=Prevotella sp. tc2-28 TaxID=1761888 RepID=UPI000898D901|nr:DUF4230 domain-containing protein [Prevotella sp. tc2-28]SEA26845.1 hypothetical protein SAMN04487851_10484 [Prevotella sp. tc2-28]